MSRAPYREDPLAYGPPPGGRGGTRWDTERFAMERDRDRFGGERDRFEERDTRITHASGESRGLAVRTRERSVDEAYERRGPRGFEDDRFERRTYYDDEPRLERERPIARDVGNTTTITIDKEKEYYSPSPPRRAPARPGFLRRQSSLDTFDRKTRFVERAEYGPPARYRGDYDPPARYREDLRPPPLTPIPLPRTRQLGPPPRRYAERDYEEIKIAEPDYYGDEEFRGYPERVREREIIRRRRRSRSRDSHRGHSHRGSVRSSSVSSSSSDGSIVMVRNEFPKKGKTRMPARLVSKKAIIDLGYPFEEEGDVIIIMKALGRENIDEVIKLSEDYKRDTKPTIETSLTTYLVDSGPVVSGARSDAGTTVFEERKTQEVYALPQPPPPPPGFFPPPAPAQPNVEIVTDTKITEHRSPSPHRHHHHNGPIIVEGGRPRHEYVDRSDPMPVGPLALAVPERRSKDERAIRAEIRALEAERDLLRAEKRGSRIRHHGGRSSENELVIYDRERFERDGEEVTVVRRERIEEPDGGVRIERDRKGRMAISVPKYVR